MQCPTQRAAAEMCGISESKLYKRLNNPTFKEKYARARRDLLEKNCAALQNLMTEAIGAMGEVVKDPDAPQQVKLNAAEMIMRNCMKLTEQTDILERLDALEKLNK